MRVRLLNYAPWSKQLAPLRIIIYIYLYIDICAHAYMHTYEYWCIYICIYATGLQHLVVCGVDIPTRTADNT